MRSRSIFTIILLISMNNVFAQPWFERADNINVKVNSSNLKMPWAGGLNFCQFSEIDLNGDQVKDLFVFDRTGDRITTYINKGTNNQVAYEHAPEYQSKFPSLRHWVLLVDYNCDGKEDIFSYSQSGVSGIEVYKNVTPNGGELKFIKVKNLIKSNYNPSFVNLYVSSVDIPAIADFDNDGDIDIATFGVLGTFVEYHRNYSMELYGTCDSLNYKLDDNCWGKFYENFSDNSVTLNQSCKGLSPEFESWLNKSAGEKHTGSCELCIDLDGDGDKEILLGDVSFGNMTMLTNGGDSLAAFMTNQDTTFPSYDVPVNLSVFPCGFHFDADNDGKKDLIVSPNADNISNNFESVWFYKNTGTAEVPVFTFQQNNLLQDQMIDVGSGAYPVFFDYNNDGLYDILIGNLNYYNNTNPVSKIALYKNIGSLAAPEFEWVTNDYASLSTYGISNMVPAFGDLDGDFDDDLLIGAYDGKLHYFENTGGLGNPANFVLSQANFTDSSGTPIDIGQFAFPQIIDLNRDGKNDLLIGERSGNINYYQNKGTTNSPAFVKITENLGGVDVTKYNDIIGNSYPFVFEDSGVFKLFVGSKNGYIYYYDNIEGNLNGTFNLVDSMYLNIWEGASSALNGQDINNDGLMDLVIGNYSGGISIYTGRATPSSISENKNFNNNDFIIYPNPAKEFVRIEYLSELNEISSITVYDLSGRLLLEKLHKDQHLLLNISNLSSGTYIIKSVNTKNTLIKKLIIR